MTRAVHDAANHPDPAHFLKAAHAEMRGETCAAAACAGGAGPHHGGRGHAHQ
jgi:hypothetical protein